MTHPSIDRAAIHAFLADKIGGERDLLPPDHESLVDAGILDSFGLADLVAMLEATYGISVPEADIPMSTFESVARMAAYVASRRPA